MTIMFLARLSRGLKVTFAAALALATVSSTAPAANHVKIGVLTCATGPSIGLLITSSERISCSFVPDGGNPEHYGGHIRKFGLDIGITAASVIIWAVFAAQSGYQPGSLAGNYIGVSAEETVVVGLGANVLVGGSNKSIALQPLSLQAQAGLNLAVGVTHLDLVKQ
jgi:hypothetical protein